MTPANIDILQEMDPAQTFSLTGDSKVQEVIGRLKFIAKIRHGEKINVRELFVRDNDSIWQRALRTLRNASTYMSSSENVESKDATLTFIRDTVNDAITLIAVYRRDKDEFKQSIANLVVENLENSKGGIRESIATYKSDRKFISQAEAVIQTLEARIKSMKTKGYMAGITDAPFMPVVDDSPQASPTISPTASTTATPSRSVEVSPQSSPHASPTTTPPPSTASSSSESNNSEEE